MEFKLQSDEIGELVKALIASKKDYSDLECDDSSNWGSFPSLDAIDKATTMALHKHGLEFRQGRTILDGREICTTIIMHTSNQWIRSYTPLYLKDNAQSYDQAIGSSFSYQKRYDATAMLGLGKGENNDPDSNKPVQASQPSSNAISEKQLGLLKAKLGGNAEREAKLCAHYKIATLAQLPWKHMSEAINILDGKVS